MLDLNLTKRYALLAIALVALAAGTMLFAPSASADSITPPPQSNVVAPTLAQSASALSAGAARLQGMADAYPRADAALSINAVARLQGMADAYPRAATSPATVLGADAIPATLPILGQDADALSAATARLQGMANAYPRADAGLSMSAQSGSALSDAATRLQSAANSY